MREDSRLATIVRQTTGTSYRESTSPRTEEIFSRLRNEDPELYAGLIKLAKAEFAGAIVVKTETKFDWPRYVKNEVEVEEDGEKFVYVGEAAQLWFDSDAIRGKAKLSKFEKKEEMKKQYQIARWFPPQLKGRLQKETRYKKMWMVESDEYNFKYFISSGQIRNGYDCGAWCRSALNSALANQGIKFPPELFDKVFDPIESGLLRIYKEVKQK